MSEAKTSQLKGRQATAISPGEANNQNKIILPSNDTASLAQITNEAGSIAYNTDQQTIVINDGTGFQPVSGGGGGANTELSNLDSPTAINQNLTFGINNGNILAPNSIALLATDNDGSSISVGDGYIELYSGQSGDADVFIYANAATVISDDGSTAPVLNLSNGDQTQNAGLQAKIDLAASYTLVLPEDVGTAGQALVTDGNNPAQLSWATSSAAAGGNDGNIQFNNSGAIDGTDNLTWDATNQSLFLEGASGSTVETLKLRGDYQQIGLYHNYAGVDPNSRAWALYTNNPNSGEIALIISPDENTDPSVRVWSLDNNHEMFMWQNNKWFYQRNAANNGFVGMLKVDASDSVVINDAPTSIEINGGTGDITVAADTSIKFQDGSEGTVGHVWTSTDTAGSGAWAPASGGGADVNLSNLSAPTSVSVDLLPDSDGTRDLGDNGTAWTRVYAYSIYDTNDAIAMVIDQRVLGDDNGNVALYFNQSQRQLIESDGSTVSLDWDQRTLNDALGSTVADWGTNSNGITFENLYVVLPRNASDPDTPDSVTGACYYNTTVNKLKFYNGTAWETVTST